MKSYVVASFYKFTQLPGFEGMREPILQALKDNQVKGTAILAQEGINGSISGLASDVDAMMAHLRCYSGLESLHFLINYHYENPFSKAKVKLRKEIVSMGVEGINPLATPGTYLNPEEWNALLAEEDVIVIDTRNDYEVMLGTFKCATNPKTINFRDFPDYVEQQLIAHKDKKIAMFCTGGIRCEKSTAYLKQLGFEKVYQLHGGILTYIEATPKDKSLWEGSCFVFDDRVAVDDNLEALDNGTIDKEWKNNNR